MKRFRQFALYLISIFSSVLDKLPFLVNDLEEVAKTKNIRYKYIYILRGVFSFCLNTVLLEILYPSQTLHRNNLFLKFLTNTFPEEAVAEFYALYRQLIYESKSKWFIYRTLSCKILSLMWAFYIEIKIDDLMSPPIDQKIDK